MCNFGSEMERSEKKEPKKEIVKLSVNSSFSFINDWKRGLVASNHAANNYEVINESSDGSVKKDQVLVSLGLDVTLT